MMCLQYINKTLILNVHFFTFPKLMQLYNRKKKKKREVFMTDTQSRAQEEMS